MSVLRKSGPCAALALFVVLALASFASAEPISQLHPTDYVNDFAHVLDANTVTQIDNLCTQVEQKAHAQIAVVTIKSLDGADIESYASDLFKAWGVGTKSTDHGVLIILAVQDRRARVEVGYGLEPILTDGKVGSIQRGVIPQLSAGDYSSALATITAQVANVIAQDAGVSLTGASTAPPIEEPQQGPSAREVILIIVVILIVLLTPLRKVLFWWLLFGGGGRGGWGGGGVRRRRRLWWFWRRQFWRWRRQRQLVGGSEEFDGNQRDLANNGSTKTDR